MVTRAAGAAAWPRRPNNLSIETGKVAPVSDNSKPITTAHSNGLVQSALAVLRSTPPDARARVISKISTAPVMINTELINTLRLAGTTASAPNAVAASGMPR